MIASQFTLDLILGRLPPESTGVGIAESRPSPPLWLQDSTQ